MANEGKNERVAQLESGYALWHRIYESSGIILTSLTTIWLIVRIAQCPPLSGWWMPLAALLGLLAADWVSGFVHWMFDTWGSVDTPIFGKVAIRTFRHHHVDQKAITRHDFIETNGHNFSLSMLPASVGVYVVRPAEATLSDVFIGMSLVCMVFFVSMTSQIHKWAHQSSPPRAITLLQRLRVVLSPEHHSIHHAAPYQRNYCITVGWMNGPLRAVRFFETLEWMIHRVTGVVPREDDLGKEEALAVAKALEEETARAARAAEAEAFVTRD